MSTNANANIFVFIEDNPDDKVYFDTLNLVIENIQNTTCIRFTKIDFDNEDIFPYIRFQDDNGKCGSPIGQRAAEPKFDERFINTVRVSSFFLYSLFV